LISYLARFRSSEQWNRTKSETQNLFRFNFKEDEGEDALKPEAEKIKENEGKRRGNRVRRTIRARRLKTPPPIQRWHLRLPPLLCTTNPRAFATTASRTLY
jgi:hypothetical protein